MAVGPWLSAHDYRVGTELNIVKNSSTRELKNGTMQMRRETIDLLEF
jgi:hypothetical protein